MHISVHSVHGAVRALAKMSASERILFSSVFALFANDRTSKSGIPDRLENQVPVWSKLRRAGGRAEDRAPFENQQGLLEPL